MSHHSLFSLTTAHTHTDCDELIYMYINKLTYSHYLLAQSSDVRCHLPELVLHFQFHRPRERLLKRRGVDAVLSPPHREQRSVVHQPRQLGAG